MPDRNLQRTTIPKPLRGDERPWYLVDAAGKTLGRLTSRVAMLITGKDRPDFTPHQDRGAHVVIINAAQIVVTGNKPEQKLYRHHTGYMGGLKEIKMGDVMKERPETVIEKAVMGMLPKTTHRKAMMMRLHVVAADQHVYAPQNPQPISL